MKILLPKIKVILLGIFLGLVYGLALRSVSQVPAMKNFFEVMSVGFLFLGPIAIGAISIRDKQQSVISSFFWPTVPIVLACLATMLLQWEGMICIVMYLPLGIIFGGIGGLLGRYLLRKQKHSSIYAVILLPFVFGPLESRLPSPGQTHEVRSTILIKASPEKIWREIKSVRTISKTEMADSWVHKMGFPRPLAAEIDHEGVGGIRLARFERDLVFHETVDIWEPGKELSFRIAVDPKSIPPTTLDDHVTIGGPFFDVLHGTYKIENEKEGEILLRLTSQFRLSTHFNGYAGGWVTLIMNRIQNDILSVIKKRAEAT